MGPYLRQNILNIPHTSNKQLKPNLIINQSFCIVFNFLNFRNVFNSFRLAVLSLLKLNLHMIEVGRMIYFLSFISTASNPMEFLLIDLNIINFIPSKGTFVNHFSCVLYDFNWLRIIALMLAIHVFIVYLFYYQLFYYLCVFPLLMKIISLLIQYFLMRISLPFSFIVPPPLSFVSHYKIIGFWKITTKHNKRKYNKVKHKQSHWRWTTQTNRSKKKSKRGHKNQRSTPSQLRTLIKVPTCSTIYKQRTWYRPVEALCLLLQPP